MTTKQIIFVPGKNPKPEAEPHRELLWRALQEGVRRADGPAAVAFDADYGQFHLAAWNTLYYSETKDITVDIPWVDALVNKHGPTEQDIEEAASWNAKVGYFLLALADDIPALIPFLPEEVGSTAREIERYFSNVDGIAVVVRDVLKQVLLPMMARGDDILLIGHSLGAVIAYDTLWELSHRDDVKGRVDFLSLGTPMGLRYIQHRLLGMNHSEPHSYPTLIRRWVNVAAEGDVTALNRTMKWAFRDMAEQGLVDSIEDHCHGIYNFFRSEAGLNSHRSYGYLVNPAVGNIIAEWWMPQDAGLATSASS